MLGRNVAMAAAMVAALVVTGTFLAVNRAPPPSANTLRLGYFPNITHAQALYGVATGAFQRALGDVELETRTFAAGPTAIEALLTNQVDMTFVGPSPTISGVSQAGPDVLRVVAGGASGGALFIIQGDLTIATDADFSGRTFASPQAGNTQDIALKHYLLEHHHTTKDRGGDVNVINPSSNADILSLFRRGQIDGAWVPEPWATRMVLEGNGKVLVDERSLWTGGKFVTTQLVTTRAYLEAHGDILRRFLGALVEVTQRLQAQRPGDLAIVNGAILNVTGSRLSDTTIAQAFHDLNLSYDPVAPSLRTYLRWAQDLGFVRGDVTVDSLYDLGALNGVLAADGLPQVTAG